MTTHVKVESEALLAAATQLEAANMGMTAQNAGAAMPTTTIAPAGADQVSALQSLQFGAYGQLYQLISARAAAVQESLVQTLRSNAGTYETTETSNTAETGADSAQGLLGGLLNGLFGQGNMAGLTGVSNFGSAASDLLQLGSSGFLAPGALTSASSTASATTLTGSTEPTVVNVAGAPAGTAGAAGAAGAAASGSRLAAAPNWAGESVPTAKTPVRLVSAATPTTSGAPVGAVPAGIPGGGERNGNFGRLRYGVKPKVAPKSTID